MLNPRLDWGEEGRHRGGIKSPPAVFPGAGLPPGRKYGKAKPRKGRTVSTATPLEGEYRIGTVTVIEAGDIFPGLILRENRARSKPFAVESVRVLDFDSIRDGTAFRTQYVYINGAKRRVPGDAEYIVVHNPRGRGAWDGREILTGPAGRAYISSGSVGDAVRRALESRKPGVQVPDFKSEFRSPDEPDKLSAFDAEFSRRVAEREAAGPERIAPPAEEEDDGIREFVPLADPPKRKARKAPRLWQDFNAFQ